VALYGPIARDYILHDMEPEYSVIYVTLQLFTTPTIAAYLVAEHDLLTTLLETLYDHFHQALIPAPMVAQRSAHSWGAPTEGATSLTHASGSGRLSADVAAADQSGPQCGHAQQ
jgi:hypothetical protein